MRLINKDNIEIVDVFIRLYGELIEDIAPHYKGDIVFKNLPADENEYHDIMGRVGNVIYHSEVEVGKIMRSPLYYLKKKIELGRDKKAVLMYDLRAINQESDQCRKRNGGGRNGKYQNQQA